MKFTFNLEDRKVWNYNAYRAYLNALTTSDRTTGDDHSESMLDYSKLNETRMSRWDKRYEPSAAIRDALKALPKQTWLIITEGWCGDAAQNLPLLKKMADTAPQIDFKIILRDENLDIMDQFLINGTRSIPKLIAIDEQNEVLFEWGSRPKQVQDVFLDLRDKGMIKDEINLEIHKIYARSKGKFLEEDIIRLIQAKKMA